MSIVHLKDESLSTVVGGYEEPPPPPPGIYDRVVVANDHVFIARNTDDTSPSVMGMITDKSPPATVKKRPYYCGTKSYIQIGK